jgi:glutamate N-acetyltransferase / amino-acid N-acetyltransferase
MGIITSEDVVVLKEGGVTTPRGFKAGGLHCGIKKRRLDLGYIYSEVPATTAGIYTTNTFQAPPLQVTQNSIEVEKKTQAVIVNSGNANACTGEQGIKDAKEMQKTFAEVLGIKDHYVAVTSTGVIGVHLPMETINTGIYKLLNEENEAVNRFEQAILTTDTCIKNIAVQLEIDGELISIGGAAKGSGMIHPNMATMLGFITTDANIDYQDLLHALKDIGNETFNMITVDGDTSTNDMVLVMANGLANNKKLKKDHPSWHLFLKALKVVCETLAKKIARDGEGATKLVEVKVEGAANMEAARAIGKTVISSNLVKTAIYGADPNWGRIISAVGYSGVLVDPNAVKVSIGEITVVENGLPCFFDEEDAKKYLEQENVCITIQLNQGNTDVSAWGCDLTYDYIKINASYRT